MTQDAFPSVVMEIMTEFAHQTGLTSERAPRRYLWTDAFAVCEFLELHRLTGDEKFRKLALCLVDQVHHVLGRHREDDPRIGWISGLDEHQGENHPTMRGLRIGKPLYERMPGELIDELLEWERDGQYYHYLTKWMHALNRVSRETGDLTYNRWAIELAKTAHDAFTYTTLFDDQKRMYWKMSIDLSRPLVPSMGQHDPLDGFITYNDLQATAPKDPEWPNLKVEIADMADICKGRDWTTDDPLGIGGLLCDAYKVAHLVANRRIDLADLLLTLLKSSHAGLEVYLRGKSLELPADCRLAFRELGLSLGLHAVERLQELIDGKSDFFDEGPLHSWIENLMQQVVLGEQIEGFWLERKNRETDLWTEHYNINMVMLATSLVPDGYLRF
ncbi:MAG: hypothetical protein OEY31_04715 [Candidatus Bathyarchaeota archaeon]|nr:hypothetical protein [Candidatus Bathyarchaeota archaeon]